MFFYRPFFLWRQDLLPLSQGDRGTQQAYQFLFRSAVTSSGERSGTTASIRSVKSLQCLPISSAARSLTLFLGSPGCSFTTVVATL